MASIVEDNRREWNSWHMARQRCYVETTHSFENYGGRGIRMCDRWVDNFEAFLEDMGPRPLDTSLDRINPNGHYTPDNCRWADHVTQATNKRQNVNRPTRHIPHIEEVMSIDSQGHRRKMRGLTYNGVTLTVMEWATKIGMDKESLCRRLEYGWTPAQALGYEPRPPRKKYQSHLLYKNDPPIDP